MIAKLISWNIDSLNAAIEHKTTRGKMTYEILQRIAAQEPDALAIQEPKLRPGGLTTKQDQTLEELFPRYLRYVNPSSVKSGYAGTMILTKHEPIDYDKAAINAPDTMDQEGRITTLEYSNFYLSTVYTPNSGSELKRLANRQMWDQKFKEYLSNLSKNKPVIISGDMNVAHTEMDLKNDKTNHNSAGFTDLEREDFTSLLESGFTDTWRYLNPTKEDVYTWWAQISKTAKINNSGWRIDYYLVSNTIQKNIQGAGVIDTFDRADHAPIYLEMEGLEF